MNKNKNSMNEIKDKLAELFNHLEHKDDTKGSEMVERILILLDGNMQRNFVLRLRQNYGVYCVLPAFWATLNHKIEIERLMLVFIF